MDLNHDESVKGEKRYDGNLKEHSLLALKKISSMSLNRHGIEILIFIASNYEKKLLMKDIAEGLDLNKNHLSKIIFDLLSKGLIIKTTNISDVRSNYIGISNKGLLMLYSIYLKLEDFFTIYKLKIEGILIDENQF